MIAMAEGGEPNVFTQESDKPAELEDVVSGDFNVTSQGKLVKTRKVKKAEFTDDENALIL